MRRSRVLGPGPSFYAQGEPLLWLTGGCLAICVAMILSMLVYVLVMGASTFWPGDILRVETHDGRVVMGEVTRQSQFQPEANAFIGLAPEQVAAIQGQLAAESDGFANRRLYRSGNYDLNNTRFTWVPDYYVAAESRPQWALLFERMEWGFFYGTPRAFLIDGQPAATAPAEAWALFQQHHAQVRRRYWQRYNLERYDIGAINRSMEQERLRLQRAELRHQRGRLDDASLAAAQQRFAERDAASKVEYETIMARIRALNQENERYRIDMEVADGRSKQILLSDIVRALPNNQLSLLGKISVYFSRWWEFIFHDPREANMEGGVKPAIIGTVVMTLIMTIFVVPIGVLAALYLREYAKAGPLVSAVRIAINNLAGVPSIVFGVFGLGFFCYIVGGRIDWLFYEARLPTPTFGKGGVLWASATLALLTLPVVIVATEEALAAVPGSMRQGSYACGASKWQTIRRIVLPRAMPGIMTGMILAMARGAGEVAPLMLVGAVKLAPDLPFDWHNWSGSLGFIPTGPIHADRSFMHLGFHIYDVGFQSPDSEGARPMVFTTTMLLIGLIVVLNISAMWLRTKLKRRFAGDLF